MIAHSSLVNLMNFIFFSVYTYTFLIEKCSKDILLIHTLAPWCWGEKGKLTVCVIVCAPQPIVREYFGWGRLFAFARAQPIWIHCGAYKEPDPPSHSLIHCRHGKNDTSGRLTTCLDNEHKITKPKPKKIHFTFVHIYIHICIFFWNFLSCVWTESCLLSNFRYLFAVS